MLGRLVWQSFHRAKRRKALAVVSVAIGVGVASGLMGLTTHLGDLVAQDLRRYGANIVVLPEAAEVPVSLGGVTLGAGAGRLRESDLVGVKKNFWEHNILAFAPYLYTVVRDKGAGREFVLAGTWFEKRLEPFDDPQGVRVVEPWWKVDGEWLADDGATAPGGEGGDATPGLLLGGRLAEALGRGVGDTIEVAREDRRRSFRVTGLVRTGGPEEERAFARLDDVQALLDEPEAVSQVMVSALLRPVPRDLKDPEKMTPEEYEAFFCCPYSFNVAAEIEATVPGSDARALEDVTTAEGDLLLKMETLSYGMGAVAVVGAALGVLASMAQSIGARRGEMALMQVLGARRSQIVGQLSIEAAVIGVIGGACGFGVGVALMAAGSAILGFPMGVPVVILPMVMILSVAVVLAGTMPPAIQAIRGWPVAVLKLEAR